jgi:hypothetical protein
MGRKGGMGRMSGKGRILVLCLGCLALLFGHHALNEYDGPEWSIEGPRNRIKIRIRVDD